MKTIVFILVPVPSDKDGKTESPANTRGALKKVRHILFSRRWQTHEPEQPYWTWFIENHRPNLPQ
jgi:hypothetical protein